MKVDLGTDVPLASGSLRACRCWPAGAVGAGAKGGDDVQALGRMPMKRSMSAGVKRELKNRLAVVVLGPTVDVLVGFLD